jgi:hypothetical protein
MTAAPLPEIAAALSPRHREEFLRLLALHVAERKPRTAAEFALARAHAEQHFLLARCNDIELSLMENPAYLRALDALDQFPGVERLLPRAPKSSKFGRYLSHAAAIRRLRQSIKAISNQYLTPNTPNPAPNQPPIPTPNPSPNRRPIQPPNPCPNPKETL